MNEATPIRNELNPEFLRVHAPEGTGIYIFKDGSGRPIYVGKAKNLKKRIMSYFKTSGDVPHKTQVMMSRAHSLEFILTSTDKEAFILESNLIKKHLPRYNIILRDDKQYPWLRLDPNEPYPSLCIVRKARKDGARYFGPFSSALSVRSTVKIIDRIFHLRKCRDRSLPKRSRPCLNCQLERCLGPCATEVPVEAYQQIVDQVILFLEGRSQELIRTLRKDMETASENLEFEKAAKIRDQIRAVERTVERQSVVSPKSEDQDVIGLTQRETRYQIVVLSIRKGHLTGSRAYAFRNEEASPSEVMEAFVKQYYPRETFIPKYVLLSEQIEDPSGIQDWISELAGKRVYIECPSRGEKARLIKMAVANAENLLKSREEPDLIAMAQEVLKLRKLPRAMEAVDISNIFGDMAVGAVVTFMDGEPQSSGYRNFRIKTVEGVDDYSMMAELISRRLSNDPMPDLIVVDGGKGHLAAVKKVVDALRADDLPDLVAIAKANQEEEADKVFIPGRKNPIPLRKDHPVLHLLMRVRDEVHRRAISYHRKLRGKGLTASVLDRIPGIGIKKKRSLLNYFGSLDAVAGATVEDLLKVPGITRSQAESIADFFSRPSDLTG
ncbi:MAG: excinuclease ABC subunit UvrC [Deltaproteobacteria bacterium]